MVVPDPLPPAPRPPDEPGRSPGRRSDTETTRLLCAGTYLSARFRRQVENLLVTHDERALAPASGVDVFAVLAHARRSRRLERTAAVHVAVLWVLFALTDLLLVDEPFSCDKAGGEPDTASYLYIFPLPSQWFWGDFQCDVAPNHWVFNYTCVSLLLWLAGSVSGRRKSVYEAGGGASGQPVGFLFTVIGPAYLLTSYWVTAFLGVREDPAHWVAVAFPLLLAVPVWVHRRTIERMMRDQFHTDTFGQRRPERLTGPAWLQGIGEVIKREQDSKIVLYDVDRGFTGLGRAASTPVPMVTDLRRKPGVVPEPVTSADVLRLVREELEELRKDTAPRRPTVDRLREVQIDDLVYLPAKPPRALVDHGPESAERHLREAVEEGGEARRYYLRARISAWEQQITVTALVRACVQGRSLTLETFFYVMDPLQPEFGLVDAIADQGPDLPVSSVARALLTAPASGLAALFSLASSPGNLRASVRRRLDRRSGWDTPSRGASGSVRELAAAYKESPVLEMDVNRYLTALLERITNGTLRTLREKGYDTGQLEQQAVHVGNGNIFIGAMSGGAVAAGRGARARNAGARTVGARRQPRARV
ncbi:hypothetical protein IHE55_28035 [Streptomyces pactum]|uniref:Uncharacterized protein n=1 Tax=Streptomyces pactum TaxID=68249 RepID=A0ABS0NT80_9ACTN|nr:hypothetical protein [Streptomyces pactum]